MVRGPVALGCLLAAHVAFAQPVELDVDAECELAPAVRAIGTFVTTAAAKVQITERALTATIMLDDGAGHTLGPRVIQARSCKELASSVAVVIAMALPAIENAVADSSAVDAVIAAAAEQPPAAPADPPPELVPVRGADRRSELVQTVEAPAPARDRSVSVAFGVSSTLGMTAALGMRWRRETYAIAAEVEGERAPSVTVSPGARVEVERFAASVAACRPLGAVDLCGLVRAGLDRGAGTGLMEARSAVEPLLAAGVRGAWAHPMTDRIALVLRVDALVAVTTSQFDADHVAVWQSNRFEALAAAGLLVRFP